MSKEIEPSYFDECGNEIMEGDLLQVYHFRERHRRRIHYMYQVVVLEDFGGKLFWSAKQYHIEGNKGHYRLKAVANKTSRIISGTLVIDSKDAMRELRKSPKITFVNEHFAKN